MMRWPWQHVETSCDEAKERLAELESRDAVVADLGRQLRSAKRRNHFSEMVTEALQQVREA